MVLQDAPQKRKSLIHYTLTPLIEEVHNAHEHREGSEKSDNRETCPCLTLFSAAFPRLTHYRALSRNCLLRPGERLLLRTQFKSWLLTFVTFSLSIGWKSQQGDKWWEEGREGDSEESG